MLATLLRGSSAHKQSALDSVTDDAHTRNLLFGQSQHVYTLSNSPPPSPIGVPGYRPSSFDDQGGLELEEKDIRVLLAQDACGGDEGPTLLFDSRRTLETKSSPRNSNPIVRSPLPTDWRPSTTQSDHATKSNKFRNRSSTISGASASWARPSRDTGSKEDILMDCMFGVTTSAKSSSSTKMHIIPAELQMGDKNLAKHTSFSQPPVRRTPLARAQTSGQAPVISATTLDKARDTILITRLFTVTLPEQVQIAPKVDQSHADTANSSSRHDSNSEQKRPKLVERKVPAFAIGLVLQLPSHTVRPTSVHSRTSTRSHNVATTHSTPSSFGSELQNSWSFLDAIPTSLSSSRAWSENGDKRMEAVVDNWDIILRSIASFEQVANRVIMQKLLSVLESYKVHEKKEPKEPKMAKAKTMQRVNQRIIAISSHDPLFQTKILFSAAEGLTKRINYGFRIPRVVTGTGLDAGHWTDESRILHRICGNRQQNFFLFNLLSAFLGNHTQWLERLAPDWYRKQHRAQRSKAADTQPIPARTIIVSDQKGLARRLVYILASFLPGDAADDALHKISESPSLLPFSTSSPSAHLSKHQSLRRRAQRGSRGKALQVDAVDKLAMSTSASSVDSDTAMAARTRPGKGLSRQDSGKIHIDKNSILPLQRSDSYHRKPSGATSATVTQNPVTPMAYISTARDSYFSEDVLVETDSIATADLSKLLQRAESGHRRSSSVSSRWGSLVSGLSDYWAGRPTGYNDTGSATSLSQANSSPVQRHKRFSSTAQPIQPPNALQKMVDDLDKNNLLVTESRYQNNNGDGRFDASQTRSISALPSLHVDEGDGVVDVELDLPGFVSWSGVASPKARGSRVHSRPMLHVGEGSDSVCSLKSNKSRQASQKDSRSETERVNVAGYLKRFHQDFVLHAVKDYKDLEDDIKNAMRAEPISICDELPSAEGDNPPGWVTVSSTLVANTKTFNIRRLTLRRRKQLRLQKRGPHASSNTSSGPESPVAPLEEEITDEVVLEFDPIIVEALEGLLSVKADTENAGGKKQSGHSRNASTSTTSTLHTYPKYDADLNASLEQTRSDQRHVVIGALEVVVKSVNEKMLASTSRAASPEENILREGVKRWMKCVQETKVW